MGDHGIGKPQGIYASQPFSRLDSPRSNPLVRNRASTLQNVAGSENFRPNVANFDQDQKQTDQSRDIFEEISSNAEFVASRTDTALSNASQEFPHRPDVLPIELVSLIDRYVPIFLNEVADMEGQVHRVPYRQGSQCTSID